MRKPYTSGKSKLYSSVTPISNSSSIQPRELLAAIAVNFGLCAAAIASIINIIPIQAAQVVKLHELEQEVELKQKAVNCLWDEFSNSFAIGSTQVASLRKRGFISTNQRVIKFIDQQNIAPDQSLSSDKSLPCQGKMYHRRPQTSE